MTKVSSCMICGEQFDSNQLDNHEKICLENMKCNDVQYTREETKEENPGGNPHYDSCHLCGKLYSRHSMGIHIKQCEKTRAMKKSLGTNVDYKIKSRSLADLSDGKFNCSRPPVNRPSSRTPIKRSTTADVKENMLGNIRDRSSIPGPSNRINGFNISSSMDNLTIANKKEISGEVKMKNLREEKSTSKKEKFNLGETNHTSTSSSGLHKCYLCGQLYGIRSLPIHEKQCYAKQKRSREEEGVSQRKRGEIKVIPFNRSKYLNNPSGSVVRPTTMVTPS